MRIQSFLLALVVAMAASAQKDRIDFAHFEDFKEKMNISESCRLYFKQVFDVFPTMSLEHLYIKQEYAFLIGNVSDASGNEVDFAKFNAAKRPGSSPFKGRETRVLLKKISGKWQVLTLLVSSEDYSWACWWVDYNAPKEIFDYTDYCR